MKMDGTGVRSVNGSILNNGSHWRFYHQDEDLVIIIIMHHPRLWPTRPFDVAIFAILAFEMDVNLLTMVVMHNNFHINTVLII